MDPSKKFEEVDRWKDYFDSTGKDVFEVMEYAIKVASRYRPAGLLQHRSDLAQKLFKTFDDDEDSNEYFEEMTEDGQEVAQTENTNVTSTDEEHQERPRNIIRIKLKPKAQTESTKSTCIDEEHQEKLRHIIRIRLKPKEKVLADHKQEETASNGNEVDLKISIAAKSEESTTAEKLAEARKRKIEDQYEEFRNTMKRIRMMDLKNIPTPSEDYRRSCGGKFKRRPVVYRIRRTIA